MFCSEVCERAVRLARDHERDPPSMGGGELRKANDIPRKASAYWPGRSAIARSGDYRLH